ncbi:DUF2254 domain-containing protein [Pedobacter arcticus]|uniref:DUF2254 domain-containing protein n=1 Tax=Pedobacter arcticus TaxID=752140 RepID=UPI000316F457|nr:DUF2254 domain-containing protein [Pedobacter arcticus]
MIQKIKYWFINRSEKILNSISFYPALIGILFLIVAVLMLAFDFSIQGKNIKAQLSWLSIKDASTARSIISAIAAGIISLAVFSFSMVMIVLNQAASQMSNRVLDKLIGNRFQQIVLGIYIGTIVYSFFLLSTIRDIDSGLYIPSLSTYLLILITIFDIFLFIYFLHYITQSVKYEVIIRRIFGNTFEVLKTDSLITEQPHFEVELISENYIYAIQSGIYEGFDSASLIKLCKKYHVIIQVLITPGFNVLKGYPLAKIDNELTQEQQQEIADSFFINHTESIELNYFYGFRQLTEIAMKALSPGINDPGTAIIAIRALFELYLYRLQHFPKKTLCTNDGKVAIILEELSFDKVFADTIAPIWNYGKEDRMIQQELLLLIPQLQQISNKEVFAHLFNQVQQANQKQLFPN